MSASLRLPWFRIALALCLVVYGVVSLACGGPEPYVPPQESPAAGSSSAEPGSPDERPSYGRYEPSSEEGAWGAAAGPATPRSVRFAVDEAALEMAVPMVRHVQTVGGQSVTTSAVASGDWFVENFVYRGSQLDTVSAEEDERLVDAVVLALRHRQHDAELVVWAEPLSPLDAERYLDVVVDDVIARLVAAPTLLDAPSWAADPERLATLLHGLALHPARLAERDALQVDLLRTHPVSLVRQRIRLLTLRQSTAGGTVLVHVALAARRDDFASLAPELGAVASQLTLTGVEQPLGLNPQRQLGPVTDQFGLDLAPLEIPDLGSSSASALATRVGRRTASAVVSATRGLLALPRAE